MRLLKLGLSPNVSWTFVSNGVTGLTTISISFALQIVAGSQFLGEWALATTPMVASLAIQRAVLSQNVLRGCSSSDVTGLRGILGALVAVSCGASAGLIWSFGAPWILLVATAGVPLTLVQDYYRYRQFGIGRPKRAAESDIAWLLLAIVISIIGLATAGPSGTTLLVAHLLGCAASVTFSFLTWPANAKSVDHPGVYALTLESLVVYVIGVLPLIFLASVVSTTALGQYRLALSAVQPVTFFASFSSNFFTPRVNPLDRREMEKASFYAFTLSLLCGSLIVAFLLLLPGSLLAALRLQALVSVIPAVALLSLGFAVGAGLQVWLIRVRLTRTKTYWLSIRISSSAVELLASVGGGALFGANGLAIGPLSNGCFTLTVLGATPKRVVEQIDSKKATIHRDATSGT